MRLLFKAILLTCFFTCLSPSDSLAEKITAKGKVSYKLGEKLPTVQAKVFQIDLGGAIIKKVRNSSELGFVIEGEGGVVLYQNKGGNAKGIRLGPGRYRVYPYLDPDHKSDTITLELEPQETGEWITQGGRQNINKYRK